MAGGAGSLGTAIACLQPTSIKQRASPQHPLFPVVCSPRGAILSAMVTVKCSVCGTDIHTYPSMVARKKFCGRECLGKQRAERMKGNKYRVGITPAKVLAYPPGFGKWMKGRHNSPRTEFKKGENRCAVPIGTVRIRNDKNGKPRATVKIAMPNKWKMRAHVAWETVHGPVPRGVLVHHKNRDTLDDRPENLEIVTRAEHMNEHRHEQDMERKRESMRAAWERRRARTMHA